MIIKCDLGYSFYEQYQKFQLSFADGRSFTITRAAAYVRMQKRKLLTLPVKFDSLGLLRCCSNSKP